MYSLGIQLVYKDGRLVDEEGFEYDGKRLKMARHGRRQAITTGDLENILSHPSQQSLLDRWHKCQHELHKKRRPARHTRRHHRHRTQSPARDQQVFHRDRNYRPADPAGPQTPVVPRHVGVWAARVDYPERRRRGSRPPDRRCGLGR